MTRRRQTLYTALVRRGTGELIDLLARPFEDSPRNRAVIIRVFREPGTPVRQLRGTGLRVQILRSDLSVFRPDR